MDTDDRKEEWKSVVARECWTRHWQKELCLPQIVNVSIVLFSHRMPTHTKNEPLPTHIIPKAFAIVALVNLKAAGALINHEDEADG